jgi:hypothetical protein
VTASPDQDSAERATGVPFPPVDPATRRLFVFVAAPVVVTYSQTSAFKSRCAHRPPGRPFLWRTPGTHDLPDRNFGDRQARASSSARMSTSSSAAVGRPAVSDSDQLAWEWDARPMGATSKNRSNPRRKSPPKSGKKVLQSIKFGVSSFAQLVADGGSLRVVMEITRAPATTPSPGQRLVKSL